MNRNKAKIGIYICQCGKNISDTVDVDSVASYVLSLENVILTRTYSFMCSDPGQEMITEDIQEFGLNRVVVASCSPLMHELTFRKTCQNAGLNPFLFQMANIREQCSWVIDDRTHATEKAKEMVAAAVFRVRNHEPLLMREVDVCQSALVVGAGIAGIEAALKMADAGKQVYLVEREPSIGGHMAQLYKTFPTLDCAA
jgi:heterodisulfide reductase subunit A